MRNFVRFCQLLVLAVTILFLVYQLISGVIWAHKTTIQIEDTTSTISTQIELFSKKLKAAEAIPQPKAVETSKVNLNKSKIAFVNVVDQRGRDYMMGILVQHMLLKKKFGSTVRHVVAYTRPFYALRVLDHFGIEQISLEDAGKQVQETIVNCGPCKYGTFAKIAAFRLYDQFDKVIVLDCDIMPLGNIDHMFAYPGPFAVSFEPDRLEFNSGVFILEPTQELWEDVMDKLRFRHAQFPNANFSIDTWGASDTDQNFLTSYFYLKGPDSWNALHNGYNYLITQAERHDWNQRYTWAFRKSRLLNVHFTWPKPWLSFLRTNHGVPKSDTLDRDKGWAKPWKISMYKSWWMGIKIVFELEGAFDLLSKYFLVDEGWNHTVFNLAYPEIPPWLDHPDWRISAETYDRIKIENLENMKR